MGLLYGNDSNKWQPQRVQPYTLSDVLTGLAGSVAGKFKGVTIGSRAPLKPPTLVNRLGSASRTVGRIGKEIAVDTGRSVQNVSRGIGVLAGGSALEKQQKEAIRKLDNINKVVDRQFKEGKIDKEKYKKAKQEISTLYSGQSAQSEQRAKDADAKKFIASGADLALTLGTLGTGTATKTAAQQGGKAIAKKIIMGATEGAASGTATAVKNDYNLKDTVKTTALGAALGTIPGAVGGVVGARKASKAGEYSHITRAGNVPYRKPSRLEQSVAKISATKPGSKIIEAKDAFTEKFVNNLTRVEKAFKDVIDPKTGRSGVEVVREMAGNVRQFAGRAEARRAENQGFKELGEIAQSFGKTKREARNLFQEEVIPFLKTKQDAINQRKLGKSVEIPIGTETQEKAYAALNRATKDEVQYLYDNGIIDKDKYTKWMADEDFTRVQRDVSDDLTRGFGQGPEGSLGKSVSQQKLKGSSKEMIDPVAAYIDWSNRITREAEVNKLATFITDTMADKGLARTAKAGQAGADTLSVFKQGIKEIIQTDPQVVNAIKNMDKVELAGLQKVFVAPSRLLKAGATGFNVAFTVPNYVRDEIFSFINSKNAMATHSPAAFYQGIKEAIVKPALRNTVGRGTDMFEPSPLFKEYLKRNKYMTSVDLVREIKKASAQGYEELGIKNQNILRTIEGAISATEQSTRFQNFVGTYQNLAKKNPNLDQEELFSLATQAARENSIDFSQKGAYSQFLRIFNPYTPAAIQGSRTLARSLKERPVGTMMKIGATVMAPIATATYWNLSDPERARIYANIPQYDRENNIIMVLGNGYAKIPLPPGVSSFSHPLRNLIEAEYLGDRQGFLETAKNLLVDPFSPIGKTKNELISGAVPQVARPALEVGFNKNLYFGNDIVPERMKDNPPEEQVYDSTSQIYRDIGRLTNTSPLMVKNTIRGYGAGGGEGAVENIDALTGRGGNRNTLSQVLGRFYKAPGNQVETTFYEKNYNSLRGRKNYVSEKINNAIAKNNVNEAQRLADNYNKQIEEAERKFRTGYGRYEGDSELLKTLNKLKINLSDRSIKSRKKNMEKK